MLTFDQQGYLKPYEPIETDLETFEKTFAISSVRKAIFEQYLAYLSDLQEIIPNEFYQWIDGSFVTKKPLPFDLDVVTFVENDIYKKNKVKLENIKIKYPKIDAYFAPLFANGHPDFFKNHIIKLEWERIYVGNRRLHPKGIIQINF